MARWAGWGAGPSGAGSTGGPSRIFLWAATVAMAAVAAATAAEERWGMALASAGAALYFALRATGKLGPRREP